MAIWRAKDKPPVELVVANLPLGSTQEIVLDVRGRKFPKELIENVVADIQASCAPVYKDIPVTVMSY